VEEEGTANSSAEAVAAAAMTTLAFVRRASSVVRSSPSHAASSVASVTPSDEEEEEEEEQPQEEQEQDLEQEQEHRSVRRRRGATTKNGSKRNRHAPPRRQPARNEFASEELFQQAWNKWRVERNINNAMVKKSRQRAKQMRLLEAQRERRERLEARTPQEQISDMEKEILLLIKAFQTRHLLTRTEEAELRMIISHYTGVAPEEDAMEVS
jgi:hypothetical protein